MYDPFGMQLMRLWLSLNGSSNVLQLKSLKLTDNVPNV